jgi:hypothetical protein
MSSSASIITVLVSAAVALVVIAVVVRVAPKMHYGRRTASATPPAAGATDTSVPGREEAGP